MFLLPSLVTFCPVDVHELHPPARIVYRCRPIDLHVGSAECLPGVEALAARLPLEIGHGPGADPSGQWRQWQHRSPPSHRPQLPLHAYDPHSTERVRPTPAEGRPGVAEVDRADPPPALALPAGNILLEIEDRPLHPRSEQDHPVASFPAARSDPIPRFSRYPFCTR